MVFRNLSLLLLGVLAGCPSSAGFSLGPVPPPTPTVNQQPRPEPKTMKTGVPGHIAFIMDGNGRWAQKQGLRRVEGYMEGAMRASEVITRCGDLGVDTVSFFCFSTENWCRPALEVAAIYKAVEALLLKALDYAKDKNGRVVVIGQRDRLPDSTRDLIERAAAMTRTNSGLTVCLAISYGGQDEIATAAKAIAYKVLSGDLDPQHIDQDLFESHLPSVMQGLACPPDLLIRTSGENRLSNFMLYQLAYTEIYTSSVLWPDFDDDHLDRAVQWFATRNRRYGGA